MITNNAYLDGLIHRSLRKNSLNGNSRSHEETPEGEKDENVFDIQQGVAIIFLIKN